MKLLIILGSLALVIFIMFGLLCCLRASSAADDMAAKAEAQAVPDGEKRIC